ncbi:MAG: YebC/PmpR family DNA-binding transcriptional regulator [Myxococcota bacterium]
MSGHSKWSTIKRKKGIADAKRGKIFTKLIREIQTAARIGGGEIDSNPRLRLVVDKSKSANMPKDNISRAIKKGIGGSETEAFEECVYEGYGPAGVAVLVEALTDNKNRTVGEIRHVFTRHGGNLGASGCVAYLFDKKGTIEVDPAAVDSDTLMEAALEAGAEDFVESGESLEVHTAVADLETVKAALEARQIPLLRAEVSMEASTQIELSGDDAASMLKLSDALEDLDDVQNVFANFDISDEEMSLLV